jgi:hypothetical protein
MSVRVLLNSVHSSSEQESIAKLKMLCQRKTEEYKHERHGEKLFLSMFMSLNSL